MGTSADRTPQQWRGGTNAAGGEGSLRRRRPLAATLSHLRRGLRALVFVLALGAWAAAAAAQPGLESPAPEFPGLTPLNEVPVLETPPINVRGALAAARAASAAAGPDRPDRPSRFAEPLASAADRPDRPDRPGGPSRFAEPFTVDVSPLSHGRWETTLDGRTAVWRLRVVSEGAVSLNFGFTRYRMPPGGRLRVHTPDGAEGRGPYTAADNEEHGQLWTPILSGGDAVIEVVVPVDRIGELDLGLARVNRGFRDLVSPPANCDDFAEHFIDVTCSAGNSYRDQIRSVGAFSIGGFLSCTGAAVNNTAMDGTPYFLTARHCFEDSEAPGRDLDTLVASVVVYWNFERPSCSSEDRGALSDSQSGAMLVVERATLPEEMHDDQGNIEYGSGSDTDTVLLRLDDALDPAHHVYLSGWDAGSSTPKSAVGIHHPFNCEKSINIENDPPTRTAFFGDSPVVDGDYWRVDYDEGGTFSGSSGSPLFDHNKRIVGALRGGDSRTLSWYGALTKSWTSSDGSALRQLSNPLAPGDTGVTSLDGMNANTGGPSLLRALDDKAVKVPGTGETAETLSVDLAPFFSDPDGHTLTYTATSSAETAVTVSVTGSTVSLTPELVVPVRIGQVAVATITVTVTDGGTSEATSRFKVTAWSNRSPETGDPLDALTLNEGDTKQVALAEAFTDDDGDTLTLAVASTDTAVATVALSGTTLTVTAVDGPGTATIDVTATDAGGSNTKARHRFDVTVPGGGGDGGGGNGGGDDGGNGGGDDGGNGGGDDGGNGGRRPRDDHGNSAGQATRIQPGGRTVGQLHTRSDVDYFTLTAPQAGVLVVETTGSTDTRATVRQAGVEVARADSGGSGQNFRLSTRVAAGPVVIAVRGNGRQTGRYTLQTTLVAYHVENPPPTSFQSGLGVISGWVCEADAVTIEIEKEDGEVVELTAAYGTERADTATICGDSDNGFGLLFNWNLLGDGTHAVVVLVDGVEVGQATVTVTTLGEEFRKGLTGSVVVADFPRPGEQMRVVWQESQQNFVLAPVEVGAASAPTPSSGGIEGVLENPTPASYQSGIGVISGWVCAAEEVVIEIDGQPIAAAAGTERADTLDRCGDTDNGFGLLVNWAEFGAGEHEVVALVDGVELSRATVTVTVVDATEPYVRGLAKRVEVAGFPTPDETVTLEWQQSQQNFVITGVD